MRKMEVLTPTKNRSNTNGKWKNLHRRKTEELTQTEMEELTQAEIGRTKQTENGRTNTDGKWKN